MIDPVSLFNILVDPAGFALIDLRPPADFARGHIIHSTGVPYGSSGGCSVPLSGKRVVLLPASNDVTKVVNDVSTIGHPLVGGCREGSADGAVPEGRC